MNDPLHDPRFPDRPQHPDFWRLSEVCLQLDGAATEGGKEIPEITADLIDMESLDYLTRNRVGLLVQALGIPFSPEVIRALETVFFTSVLTGIAFEKKGGHRA